MKKPNKKMLEIHPVEIVEITKLKNHPQNYRVHVADQMQHIEQSIKEHGIYKNVVVAEDGTILAGHGVVKTAKEMGRKEVPVVRLPIAPSSETALKILTGDNEISRLAEVDDRNLSEILKSINESGSLKGTGYDEMMLANLVMVTRPANEIKSMNEAKEWVGMPEYEEGGEEEIKLTINFKNEKDKAAFLKLTNLEKSNQTRLWWPPKKNADTKSLKFE